MSSLDLLKCLCVQHPFKSFKDLDAGQYMVRYFSVVNTSLGERVRIDLDDCYMYLPERFGKILKGPVIDDLNCRGPIIMDYKGKDEKCMNRLILDFKDAPIATAATSTAAAGNVDTSMGNLGYGAMEYHNNFSHN